MVSGQGNGGGGRYLRLGEAAGGIAWWVGVLLVWCGGGRQCGVVGGGWRVVVGGPESSAGRGGGAIGWAAGRLAGGIGLSPG